VVIRAYKYLFYKLCLFERIMFDPVPGLTGFCFMLALQFFNLFSLYLVLNRFFGFVLPFKWSAANYCAGVILLTVPQYFFLLHGERFRRVVREVGHESEHQSIMGGLIVGVYVVFSFVFFFWAVLLPPRNV
jgi:hypothetical protein